MSKSKAQEPEITQEQKLYYAITYSLYRNFQPFPGQLEIGKAIFTHNARMVFVRCGRGWGKTLTLAWLASKKALETPNSLVYLTAPLYKQAKRIYWLSGLLDDFIDADFVEQRSNQETYLVLKNGSQIFVDGSDNYDAHRGLKPNFVIADEYADFDPKWVNVMMPNVAKTRGQMIFIGTPPEMPRLSNGEDHHYVQLRKQIQEMSVAHPGKAFFITKPTSDNPFSDKEFLADEQKRLGDLGMSYVYEREYEAREVSGSSLQVFPMFDSRQDLLYCSHEQLMKNIYENPDKYEYGCFADPGTKSVFAVRFMAINRYTGTPYWLDEIYETNPEETVPSVMCPRIKAKMFELAPDQNWNLVADSAASSFIIDAMENHDMVFAPCIKQAGDKTEYLGILARVFLEMENIISDRCIKTRDEYVGYVRGPDGRPIKHRDHLIDADRYGMKYLGFTFIPKEEKKRVEETVSENRMRTIEQDMRELRRNDLASQILGMYE